MNFSKMNKLLTFKTGKITCKGSVIFYNNEPISTHKVSMIYISGDTSITNSAICFISLIGITIIFKHNHYPITHLNPGLNNSKYHIAQLKNVKKIKQQKKIIIKLRSSISKQMGLPMLSDFIKDDFSLLDEARYMKYLYVKICKKFNISWKGKKTTGSETNMHFWWYLLYALIETACMRIGVNPHIGIIHKCKKGLVYDVSDIIKPIFLQDSIISEKGDVKAFWDIYKKYKVNMLIIKIIGSIVTLDHSYQVDLSKHLECSLPRSHPYHE